MHDEASLAASPSPASSIGDPAAPPDPDAPLDPAAPLDPEAPPEPAEPPEPADPPPVVVVLPSSEQADKTSAPQRLVQSQYPLFIFTPDLPRFRTFVGALLTRPRDA
jgi:hypothetical protein